MAPKKSKTSCLFQETRYINSLLQKVFLIGAPFKNQVMSRHPRLMKKSYTSAYPIINVLTGYIYLDLDPKDGQHFSHISLSGLSQEKNLSDHKTLSYGSNSDQGYEHDKGKCISLDTRSHQQSKTILDLPSELVNLIYNELESGSDNGEMDMLALGLTHPKFYTLLKRKRLKPIRFYNLWDDEHADFLTNWMGSEYRVVYQPKGVFLNTAVYGKTPGLAEWEFWERFHDSMDLRIRLAVEFPDCTVPEERNKGNAWYYEAFCLYTTGLGIGRDWERCWARTRVMQKWKAHFALCVFEEWIEAIGF